MKAKGFNHPFVVLASCTLWVISMFSIVWSLLLFFCVSDILFLTGTDLVNAVVLLSGIIMLPTNLYIVYSIANGQKIEYTAKVACCRLWMGLVWTIIINLIGVLLCLQRIYLCEAITIHYLSNSMKHYRTIPKHKHFIDNLQWSLGCCGPQLYRTVSKRSWVLIAARIGLFVTIFIPNLKSLTWLHFYRYIQVKSYKDWFTRNWHDKIRDFDWSPRIEKSFPPSIGIEEIDSVPLSCCKSGSCVATYLKELGTYSIHTAGCGYVMYKIIMISMNLHLFMFVLVIILEACLLKSLMVKKKEETFISKVGRKLKLKKIMSVNDNFEISSASYQLNAEDSDEVETSRNYKDVEEN